ncbi:uncharacterized protein F4822DRAFT_445899 [Hypoxylon trugodes]|uniref:uncharacterized protein n=1 Tax=Hypoxylon trugodes TaxID=326681 RepID=UPI00218D33E6|nr:uncharacterized protein F4822DRAFT_445899 [Hypoxylon trugodes]KAI1384476.1 hypothetical protein F4822DRAFT_445899 [Hypoxylon trugodes]
MAEAALGLSVAANIIQVVDFGTKFISLAWKIWQSGNGTVSELNNLRLVSKSLQATLQQTEIGETSPLIPIEDATNGRTFALAEECYKTAQKVIDSIEGLKIPEGDRTEWTKRKAIVAAFKVIWRKEEITALEAQLSRCRDQIVLDLAVSLRACVTKSVDMQESILKELMESRCKTETLKIAIDDLSRGRSGPALPLVDQTLSHENGLGSTLINYLTTETTLIDCVTKEVDASEYKELGRKLRSDLLKVVYNSAKSLLTTEAPVFEIDELRKSYLEKKYLLKLDYDGMHDRVFTVPDAHRLTFRWIFEEEKGQQQLWANFPHWLESDQQFYWITGKAGSGISTLMKFITQPTVSGEATSSGRMELRCTEHLLKWAKERPLLVASFYFWGSGTNMQSSKEGLYRTLLSQIIQAYPEVIPHISPKRWEALCLYNEDPKPFSESELRRILLKTITFIASTRRLCLFIDGLDEFDGEHADLIDFVKGITKEPSVKVCVASRPWTVFEDALENKPSLFLEDLTFNDIKRYVMSRFGTDQDFVSLQGREMQEISDLIDNFVKKASGVFLWVNLVVTSLLEGIRYGDRVSDLQRRLDDLPTDLEDLYDKILYGLDPFYLEHTAQYFYIMLACVETPAALLLSYADEDDPEFALKLPTSHLPNGDMQSRVKTMRRRLNSRCKGLIGIPKLEEGRLLALQVHFTYDEIFARLEKIKVQYLHQTVKDYLKRPHVQEKLLSMVKTPFDPYLKLCSGTLAMWKTYHYKLGPEKLLECMQYASKVSQENVSSMVQILDELEKIAVLDRNSTISPTFDHLLKIRPREPKRTECFGDCFLSLAVKCDVIEYVKRKTSHGCLVRPGSEPRGIKCVINGNKTPRNRIKFWEKNNRRVTTIDDTTGWSLLLDATCSELANPSMIATLMRNGADPNIDVVFRGGDEISTVWIETLVSAVIYCTCREDAFKTWANVLQTMIAHGASTKTTTMKQAKVRLQKEVPKYSRTVINDLDIRVDLLQRKFQSMKLKPGDPLSRLESTDLSWPNNPTRSSTNTSLA